MWATTLFDEVTDLGYGRSYPTFTRQLRARGLRPHCEPCHPAKDRAVAVIEHPPGDETQWDWVELPGPPAHWGWGSKACLLVGALAHSGRWRGWLSASMDQPHLVEGLDRVTRALGGVTAAWRFDRMATVVHPESGRVTASSPRWPGITACRFGRARLVPESPAVTDRWKLTYTTVDASAMAQLEQQGFGHPAYARPVEQAPPWVRVRAALACDSLGDAPGWQELRRRFTGLLSQEAVSGLIHQLAVIPDGAAWRQRATQRRSWLEADLTAGDETTVPATTAILFLPESGNQAGLSPSFAQLTFHIDFGSRTGQRPLGLFLPDIPVGRQEEGQQSLIHAACAPAVWALSHSDRSSLRCTAIRLLAAARRDSHGRPW